MAMDVYFRQDILNVLRATYVACEGPASLALEMLQDQELQGVPLEKLLSVYQHGFQTALASVALAFGLVALGQEQGGHADCLAGESGLRGPDLLGFLRDNADCGELHR